MQILLFEDHRIDDLSPLTLMRPAFELICGRTSLRCRIQRWFPGARLLAHIRPWLRNYYQEQHPGIPVNDLVVAQNEATLMINGRWIPEECPDLSRITFQNAGFVNDDLAWVLLEPEESHLLCDDEFSSILTRIAALRRSVTVTGRMARYPWDLVAGNHRQLIFDFLSAGASRPSDAEHVQVLGDPRDIFVSAEASIDPYVVIDVSTGPVSVEPEVRIQSFTRIEGPCHIGRGSRIFRALIHGGTTIGEHCRVGGEIEESILHAFVNKYHEGFLGHSYVCPWVNLGAMTTTSDLKNDYSSVKVPVQGEPVDSGLIKVGSFIGDHTKTAIDSMFNTGSLIGVMSMVLPGGRLLPRNIPSFANISFGEIAADWPLNQWLQIAQASMKRRDCELTPAAIELLRHLYDATRKDRDAAVRRLDRHPVV